MSNHVSYPDQQLNYFTILRPSTSAVFAQMPLFVTYAASAGQRVCWVHTSTPLSCSAAGSYGREGTGLFSTRRTCPLHTSYRCANWKPERGVAENNQAVYGPLLWMNEIRWGTLSLSVDPSKKKHVCQTAASQSTNHCSNRQDRCKDTKLQGDMNQNDLLKPTDGPSVQHYIL